MKIIFILLIITHCLDSLSTTKLNSQISFPSHSSSNLSFKNILFNISNEIKTKGDLIFNFMGMRLQVANKYILDDLLETKFKGFKTDNEGEYFIDFRLVSNCDFNYKEESLYFSLMKKESILEKKINNSQYEISVEYKSQDKDNIKKNIDKIVKDCQMRKDKIENMKSALKTFSKLQNELSTAIEQIKNLIKDKKIRKKILEYNIIESEKFFREKQSFNSITVNQIDHLNNLKKNSQEFEKRELKEKDYLEKKYQDLITEIEQYDNNLEINSKKLLNLQKEIENIKINENEKSKEMISIRENYLATESIINEINAEIEKIKIDLDITANNLKISLKEKENFQFKLTETNIGVKTSLNEREKIQKEKSDLEALILKENTEIKQIDLEINTLLKKRKKKVEKLKENLELVNLKSEKINDINSKLDEMQYMLNKIQFSIKEREKEMTSFSTKNDYLNKRTKELVNKSNISKDKLNMLSLNINKTENFIKQYVSSISLKKNIIDDLHLNNTNLAKEKSILNTKKSEMEIEMKKLLSNIEDNRLNLENLNQEIKSKSNKDSLIYKNYLGESEIALSQSFIKEYQDELDSLTKDQIKEEEKLKDFLKDLKTNQREFNSLSNDMKLEIPGSEAILDMINENFISSSNSFEIINKLLDKIKN
jgi:hypothetical protein